MPNTETARKAWIMSPDDTPIAITITAKRSGGGVHYVYDAWPDQTHYATKSTVIFDTEADAVRASINTIESKITMREQRLADDRATLAAQRARLRGLDLQADVGSRTVTIPGRSEHAGLHSMRVNLPWRCITCGGVRGEPYETLSYDGSCRLKVDGWRNPCGHTETYSAIRDWMSIHLDEITVVSAA